MTEADAEVVLQRTREQFPEARPRLITDNGSAFIARDFKTFIREAAMTPVRTSPYYPQSNGKMERWNRTIKSDAIRRFQPSTLEGAHQAVVIVGARRRVNPTRGSVRSGLGGGRGRGGGATRSRPGKVPADRRGRAAHGEISGS